MARRSEINFKVLESDQKLRGGYYTPLSVAEFLSDWAVTLKTRTILEPSCGDGRFLEALSEAVSRNGSKNGSVSIDAVELNEDEVKLAEKKAKRLASKGLHARVYCEDFFSWILNEPPDKTWDAILGNPPYIRYQYFDKDQRFVAQEIFHKTNVKFTMLTNAWVPFILASVMHLAPGGRIAMVIPSEISYIIHAQGLRELLEQELEYIRIVHFREIVFDGTLQGTVLFLGIKRSDRPFRPLRHHTASDRMLFPDETEADTVDFKICDIKGIDDLSTVGSSEMAPQPQNGKPFSGHWMLALLDNKERSLLSELSRIPDVKSFSQIADITIGIVTGANNYFCVCEETLNEYDLSEIAAPMLARSELIKGITYTAEDHEKNAALGKSVHFLEFPNSDANRLPKTMREYIKLGEDQQLHERYKCRIREPWYCVPYVWVSQLSLLKRCHHFPRLVLNELGAYSTDTAYRISLKDAYSECGKDFVFSFINSYTLLLAELGGRHYAGGVLELVPSEIRALRVPLVKVTRDDFRLLDQMIRQGRTADDILDFTDQVILSQGLGLCAKKLRALKACYNRVKRRRQR